MKAKSLRVATVAVLPLLLPVPAWAECPDGKSEVVLVTRSGISKTICVDDHAIPGIEQAEENAPLELLTAFTCSKPIDALTMIWNGTGTVGVQAWKGSVGSEPLEYISNVMLGDEVTVAGYTGSPNDVTWEIFDNVTGAKLGESEFHLSCSDEDMNGPDDCGKAQGDGKSNSFGLINDWLLEGMVDSDETFDCTP